MYNARGFIKTDKVNKMKKRFVSSIVAAALLMAGCGNDSHESTSGIYDVNKNLVLNELKANIPEDVHAKQYIELRGTAGITLKNVYAVVLDGDKKGDVEKPYEDWGYVDYAIALNGVKVGENGLILIKNPNEYNAVADAKTMLVDDAKIKTYDKDVDGVAFEDGILEHGAITFMLIQSDTAIVASSDLDKDNDGKLELPSGAIVLDSVGWEAGGQTYSEVKLKQSASDPDAASRFYDNTTASILIAWANGDIYEDPNKDDDDLADEVLYDTLQMSSNLPPKAALTPGKHNFIQAPFVLLNEVVTTGNKYVELLSNAAQSMSGIYLISLDADSKGTPSFVVNLTGTSAKEMGLTIIKSADTTITTGSAVASVNADIGMIGTKTSSSLVLVYSPSNTITTSMDLDTNDDGKIDLPIGATILDNIGWGATSYSDLKNDADATSATRYKDNKMSSLAAWTFDSANTTPAGTNIAETTSILIKPSLETARTTMENPDADDVAFWIHPSDSSKSLIIGTQKEAGYSIYDVDGKTLIDVNPGNIRFNNVDVMYDFNLNGTTVDIALFTDRITNKFAIYKIQESAPYIVDVTDYSSAELFSAKTVGDDTAYGEGVYKSPVTGKFYAFATQNGYWNAAQFELVVRGNKIGWNKVRDITLEADDEDKYAEGFVIDQEYGKAYVAQEDVGIYTFDAEPNGSATLQLTENDLLNKEGDNGLVKDLEGMTIYYKNDGTGYLFISSQGNNTYGVFDRTNVGEKNTYLKSFAIVDDTNGIDGTSETDSIDVTNMAIGSKFPNGAFIVQDGMDTTANPDDTETNFKWVKWEDIASGLGDTTFASTYDPRKSTNRR